MRDGFPMPGSVKAQLIAAAQHQFEQVGFDATTVADVAAKAAVTTGAIYHHFGSKLGLYTTIRDDLEQRITDRIEGGQLRSTSPAGPPLGSPARRVRCRRSLRRCRLLGEPAPDERPDRIREALAGLLPAPHASGCRRARRCLALPRSSRSPTARHRPPCVRPSRSSPKTEPGRSTRRRRGGAAAAWRGYPRGRT